MKTFLSFLALLLFPVLVQADAGDVLEDIRDRNDGLVHGDIASQLIPSIIQIIFFLFGILLIGSIIWAGVLFVVSFDDEEKISQAKKLMNWAIVGVAVSGLSYVIVYGALLLNIGNE